MKKPAKESFLFFTGFIFGKSSFCLFSGFNRLLSLFGLALVFALITISLNGAGVAPALQRIILVKGDHYYPPFEFINDKGEPDGFNVELFRELAKELLLDFKLELAPWDQVRTELENGKIDVITGMMVSPERAKKVLFGIPHSIIYPGIFTRKKSPIHSIDDLKGKEIVVQNLDRMHDYLIENNITDKIFPVPTQMEALRMIENGEHDAALIGKYQGAFLIRKMKLRNVTIKNIEIEPQKYTFAVHPNNEELLDLLNTGLYQLKANGTYDKLYEKWFAIYDRQLFVKKYTTVGLTILSVVLLMLLFIVILKYQLNLTMSKVQKQKKFLETLINTIPNPIVYIDYSQKISGCNKAFEQFFRQPLVNDEPEKYENGLYSNKPEMDEILSGSINGRVEKMITIPATGEVRDMIIQEAELKNEKGETIGLIGIFTDITDSKNIERELEIHRNNLEKLVEQRTAELNEKNKELTLAIEELERLNHLFVGREFRIKELKEKIKMLQAEIEKLSGN